MIKKTCLTVLAFCLAIGMNAQDPLPRYRAHGNPIFTHKYTCDPAAMVKGDTLWLFTGQDVAGNQMGYHDRLVRILDHRHADMDRASDSAQEHGFLMERDQ